jgi:hypothetical protein
MSAQIQHTFGDGIGLALSGCGGEDVKGSMCGLVRLGNGNIRRSIARSFKVNIHLKHNMASNASNIFQLRKFGCLAS